MPQKESDLIPRMVAYLRRHLHDSGPSPAIPLWHDPKDPGKLKGSRNIEWLGLACMLCFDPATAVPACIAEYQRELQIGHRGFEEMTVSHDGQWLGSHYAIRTWLSGSAARALAPPAGGDSVMAASIQQLANLNDAWCGAELALMREFYLPAIGVLCPAARFEGVLVSPQRSAIARWDAQQPAAGVAPIHLALPGKGRQFNDTYCLELAADLVAAGDDLGRSVAAIPKLAYPLFVEKGLGSLRAYWNPGKEALKPVYYVEWPERSRLGTGWVTQANGLPKGQPAAGLLHAPAGVPGMWKEIG